MDRRGFLKSAALVGAGGLGVYLWNEDLGKITPSGLTNGSLSGDDASNQTDLREEFGGLLNETGFTHVRWHLDGRLTIGFADNHGMDGFLIMHEYHDDLDNVVVGGPAPDFGGEKTIGFAGSASLGRRDYPTPNWRLIAATGEIGEALTLVDERLGSVTIEVPQELRDGPEATPTTTGSTIQMG